MSSLSNESLKKVRNQLVDDEGFCGTPYHDVKGFLTIGFGFNLDKQEGLPMSIALEWLDFLIHKIESQLSKNISFWNDLNDARKGVLVNMAYQLGVGGLLNFRGMIKALARKDYVVAANEMKDSVWYREFTARASRLIKVMLSGEF